MQSWRSAIRIAPNNKVTSCGDNGARCEDEFSGIAIVAQAPAIEVDRAGARIVEFHPIRVEPAIAHRRYIIRHDFVDEDWRRWCGSGRQTGRPIGRYAGAPVGGIVRVAVRIDDFNRVAATSSGSWPAASGLIIDRQDQNVMGIEERNLFTGVS